RVRKGDTLPRINSMVDVCNWCSFEFQLPYGLYDAAHIEGDVTLRIGREDDGDDRHDARAAGGIRAARGGWRAVDARHGRHIAADAAVHRLSGDGTAAGGIVDGGSTNHQPTGLESDFVHVSAIIAAGGRGSRF